MSGPTVGALCAGYGGLEQALELAIGETDLRWVADNDPTASKILARHYPTVPNHGDITKIDWPSLERVEWATAGFPCTDLSHAGRRAGLNPGTRSGLWFHIAYGLSIIKPPNVFIENVRAIVSARADREAPSDDDDYAFDPTVRDLGSRDDALGDGPTHAGRALGVVLGDLADLGYHTEWVSLRAADVGACHGRWRTFIYARLSHT